MAKKDPDPVTRNVAPKKEAAPPEEDSDVDGAVIGAVIGSLYGNPIAGAAFGYAADRADVADVADGVMNFVDKIGTGDGSALQSGPAAPLARFDKDGELKAVVPGIGEGSATELFGDARDTEMRRILLEQDIIGKGAATTPKPAPTEFLPVVTPEDLKAAQEKFLGGGSGDGGSGTKDDTTLNSIPGFGSHSGGAGAGGAGGAGTEQSGGGGGGTEQGSGGGAGTGGAGTEQSGGGGGGTEQGSGGGTEQGSGGGTEQGSGGGGGGGAGQGSGGDGGGDAGGGGNNAGGGGDSGGGGGGSGSGSGTGGPPAGSDAYDVGDETVYRDEQGNWYDEDGNRVSEADEAAYDDSYDDEDHMEANRAPDKDVPKDDDDDDDDGEGDDGNSGVSFTPDGESPPDLPDPFGVLPKRTLKGEQDDGVTDPADDDSGFQVPVGTAVPDPHAEGLKMFGQPGGIEDTYGSGAPQTLPGPDFTNSHGAGVTDPTPDADQTPQTSGPEQDPFERAPSFKPVASSESDDNDDGVPIYEVDVDAVPTVDTDDDGPRQSLAQHVPDL